MTIADKLTLLANTKEALRVKLGLPKNLPFSEYYKHSYPFDPMTIFAGGKQGVWFDPSDKSTLFQDVAGAVPVTKDGDPVGLMLDKSQGKPIGNNLVVNGDFTTGDYTGWTVEGDLSVTVSDGVAYLTGGSSNSGGFLGQEVAVEVGKTYLVNVDWAKRGGGRAYVRGILSGTGAANSHIIFTATTPSVRIDVGLDGQQEGIVLDLRSFKIREISSNYAIQPLAASRPAYKTDGVLHWLEFDGVDDKLNVSNGALINNTISVAFEYYDTSMSIAFSESSTTYYWGYATSSVTYLNLRELGLHNLGLPNTRPMKLLLGIYSNSDGLQRMFVNSEVRGDGITWDASANNPLIIGSRSQGDRFLAGAMYSFILSDKKMLETDIEALERHTANKAGVTL